MNTATFLSIAFAGVAAGGFVALPLQAEEPVPVVPAASQEVALSAGDWADCAELAQRLKARILRELPGTDADAVRSYIAEPQHRLLLAQWFLAHRENAVDTSKHAPAGDGESVPPRSMKELLASADDMTRAFIGQLTNDVEWMEQFTSTGECVNPGRALAILAALQKRNPGFSADLELRDVATAPELEWARWEWDVDKALLRAEFYMNHYREGRFHRGFASLPFWHYRVICGSKGNNANGSLESLEWALDNVHLPVEQYPGACWQAAYLTYNLFGDSIHGAYYYAPYNDVYGENAVQRTLEVGGVCGSLSHFGAFAAIANGVPAMTAGEPGHCAYIVCVNGKWVPSYSLSWERGLHWQVWNGIHKYSSLHMATELYSPEQKEATALSQACMELGELHASAGNVPQALSCFRNATEAQPLHFLAWSRYAAFLQASLPDDAAAWKAIYSSVSKRLAPCYPEMAAELLAGRVHAGMHRACPDAASRADCYREFWSSVRSMGPDRWSIEALCESQSGSLRDGKRSDDEAILDFYTMVLGQTASNATYAPVILSWGNSKASRMNETMQKKFLEATLAALSSSGSMDAGARDNMLGEALLGAERMRDIQSFQAIGRMLSDGYHANRLPEWEPFPGQLVSRGGLIDTSSRAHDTPAEHWGVLEPTGGRFHTGNDENPWVVVMLPRMVYVTGVVAISTAGYNVYRLHDMKVQYSETGRDDDWHEAGAFPAPSARAINRLDLQASKPRARYIRIIRGGQRDCFHLNGIFVYGEQAS